MWASVKAAYKSWWTQITMLLSSVAIFNFVTRASGMELSDLMFQVAALYRSLFHPIIDLIVLPFHLALTNWQKDAALIWMAIGGATARTHASQIATNMRAAREHAGFHRYSLLQGVLLVASAFIAWPIAWIDFFNRPFFYAHTGRTGRVLFVDRLRAMPLSADYKILFDMRIVLLVQVATVAAVVATLLLINLIGLH